MEGVGGGVGGGAGTQQASGEVDWCRPVSASRHQPEALLGMPGRETVRDTSRTYLLVSESWRTMGATGWTLAQGKDRYERCSLLHSPEIQERVLVPILNTRDILSCTILKYKRHS